MSLCPVPVVGEIPGSLVNNLSLAGVIITPILVFASWAYFVANRPYYLFLRKRSLLLVNLSSASFIFCWASTVLYDYLGPSRYNCAGYGLLVYIAIPAVGGPILLQGHVYLSDVSVQTLSAAGSPISGKASMSTWIGHLKVGFLGSKDPTDRLHNAQFTRTWAFWIFWLSITVFPYLVAYFVRLATNPAWNTGCSGCFLDRTDLIIMITLNSTNLMLAVTSYSLRLRRRDSLRILRQCNFGMAIPLPAVVLGYILALLDPNNTYANGGFDWTALVLLGPLSCIYIITAHQVFVARSIKRKILLSDNVDRLDRFEDVMNDKELKLQLQRYLHSELSAEILLFLDACREVKAKFAVSKQEGEAEARLVFHTYVERNKAKYEVNLPGHVRETVALKMKGDITPDVFDEAYLDVRSHFLRDAFPRFLNKLRKEEVPRMPRKTITATMTGLIPLVKEPV